MAACSPKISQYIELLTKNNQESNLQELNLQEPSLIDKYYDQKARLHAAMQYINNPLILEKANKVYATLGYLPLHGISAEDLVYINKIMEITRGLLLSRPGEERIKFLLLHQNLIISAPGYFLPPNARYFLIHFRAYCVRRSCFRTTFLIVLFSNAELNNQ